MKNSPNTTEEEVKIIAKSTGLVGLPIGSLISAGYAKFLTFLLISGIGYIGSISCKNTRKAVGEVIELSTALQSKNKPSVKQQRFQIKHLIKTKKPSKRKPNTPIKNEEIKNLEIQLRDAESAKQKSQLLIWIGNEYQKLGDIKKAKKYYTLSSKYMVKLNTEDATNLSDQVFLAYSEMKSIHNLCMAIRSRPYETKTTITNDDLYQKIMALLPKEGTTLEELSNEYQQRYKKTDRFEDYQVLQCIDNMMDKLKKK